MEILIPKELDYIISQQNDKRVVARILKVYEALIYKKGNTNGFFPCPAKYLKKVNSQYNKAIDLFIEHGIIEYKTVHTAYKWQDLFNNELVKTKHYFPNQCMKYRFLIDTRTETEDTYKVEISVNKDSLYTGERWYQKTRYSLLQLGFTTDEIRISRDNFSRRLHTNITGHLTGRFDGYGTYKNLLAGGDYYVIDAKTCHPRLMWLILKSAELSDPGLDYVFYNDVDFYDFMVENIPALQHPPEGIPDEFKMWHDDKAKRTAAKELFMSWMNGNGYIRPEHSKIRQLFPVLNTYISHYKSSHYTDVCKLLQNKEASIFIDDLLNNVPVDFCLTVHDSLIVKKEDVERVLEWCRERQPDMIFNCEVIQPK